MAFEITLDDPLAGVLARSDVGCPGHRCSMAAVVSGDDVDRLHGSELQRPQHEVPVTADTKGRIPFAGLHDDIAGEEH